MTTQEIQKIVHEYIKENLQTHVKLYSGNSNRNLIYVKVTTFLRSEEISKAVDYYELD